MKAAIGCFIGLVFVVSLSAEPLLEGRVRLESGEPVADAQVQIFDLSDLRQGAIARAMTDGTGYFALPLVALPGRALPARFALGPNYPNPFNPSTIIPYQLAASAEVRLEVFNLLGQHIATLVEGERPAGFHTATWHAVDGAGRAVGAGVYIYRMTVGVERQTGRMVLLDGQAGLAAGGASSVMPSAAGGGSHGEGEQEYGLVVSGSGLVPYKDSSFRVEAGMAPVELVVSSGLPSAGKATDDDCAFCDLFGAFNDEQEEEEDETEEEEETDSTASEGGPDLIVQSPSVSVAMLTPGQAFTLNVTVHNQGDEQAAATMLHYYRSNNATITSSDTAVGTDAVGALDASATSAASIALTAPTSVSPQVGIYYGACVASVSGESNTDNNCSSAVKITVSGHEAPEEEEEETPEEEEEETPEEEEEETPEEEEEETPEEEEEETPEEEEEETPEEEEEETPEEEEETTPEEEEETTPEEEEEEEDDAPVAIPDANLRATIEDALGKASGAPITVAEMKTLIWLEADFDAGIRDLTGVEYAANLLGLLLSYNPITDLSPLSGLTNLWRLGLSDTNIPDLSPLSGLTNLELLSLIATNTSDVSALSGLTNLRSLLLSHNKIADISPLSGLTNLTELNFWENQIEDISPLSGLTNLTQLGLAHNKVSDISVLSGLTSLTELWLNNNKITDISPLAGLTNLTWLNLAFNNIEDISALSGLTNLRTLNLGANNVSDISPLSGLNLRDLDLRGNPYETLPKGDFDIELVLLDDFTESQKNVLQYVARRWMAVIIKDLPDYEFTGGWSGTCGGQSYAIPSGERIDDLRIYVSTFSGVGVLGHGGPVLVREETHLPVVGCMAFDLSHANLLITGLHEIGHVLGFASEVWSEFGFYQNPPDGDNHFNGPLAIAAFNDAGGRDYKGAKVPLQQTGESHWRGGVFGNELMTPTGTGALSAITVQSLADLGYGVDVTQADPYTLPGAAGKASAKIASIPDVDVTLADAYTLLGTDPHWQRRIARGLPLLPGDDRLRGHLESAEWMEGRGFDLRNDHLMGRGRTGPHSQAEPELSCGAGLRGEPIYVVDPQGRIIRPLGD